jgi:hypothetical protein
VRVYLGVVAETLKEEPMPRKSSSRKRDGNKKSATQQVTNASGQGAPKPAVETQDVERKIGQFSGAGTPPLIKK